MFGKTGGYGVLRSVVRLILRLFLLLAALFVALLVAYRFVMPVSTLMLGRMVTAQRVDRVAKPFADFSPNLISALITSEDAHFCHHHGVDWGALREVIDESGEDGPSRGASTITMQVARNVFLWQSPLAFIRKALEIPVALVIDFVWQKRRVLEIYLNIAEWGPNGTYGAEAASQLFFHKSARDLDAREAALLVSVLPDPRHRDPRHPTRPLMLHARTVINRLARYQPVTSCLR